MRKSFLYFILLCVFCNGCKLTLQKSQISFPNTPPSCHILRGKHKSSKWKSLLLSNHIPQNIKASFCDLYQKERSPLAELTNVQVCSDSLHSRFNYCAQVKATNPSAFVDSIPFRKKKKRIKLKFRIGKRSWSRALYPKWENLMEKIKGLYSSDSSPDLLLFLMVDRSLPKSAIAAATNVFTSQNWNILNRLSVLMDIRGIPGQTCVMSGNFYEWVRRKVSRYLADRYEQIYPFLIDLISHRQHFFVVNSTIDFFQNFIELSGLGFWQARGHISPLYETILSSKIADYLVDRKHYSNIYDDASYFILLSLLSISHFKDRNILLKLLNIMRKLKRHQGLDAIQIELLQYRIKMQLFMIKNDNSF